MAKQQVIEACLFFIKEKSPNTEPQWQKENKI